MKSNTIITLGNSKAFFVKERVDELYTKINDNNNFIYITSIIYYTIEKLLEKAEEKNILININHIASIEPI